MADLFAHLQSALSDRYALERELGRGGTATVYLARDLRHRRPVALKVLHPELAYALGTDRFLREIEVAANLTHPHIVPLHESGEVGGLLYYVMPYIEGESLRERLRREPQLPVDDAVRLAREVADALTYAHGQGVIHRDIKPENILLSSGHALVTDFGLARAISQASSGRLTGTGLAVGTAVYMSPEQASGETQLDGRSDVYSLTCVLYEMLAGEPPYRGPTAQAAAAQRYANPVPTLRTLRPTAPEWLNEVIVTGLAPLPPDRFATAAELGRALSGHGAGATPARPAGRVRTRVRAAVPAALVIVALIAGGLLWWRDRPTRTAATGPTRVAVLPFENLGDSADGYFTDGMTEAVRGKLSSLSAVQVIAKRSSSEYRNSTKSPDEIGRELGADYVLTATVRRRKVGSDQRVQVTPELVEVSTASTRWQQPFDAALTDVFQVQGEIAGQVAGALELPIGTDESQALAERPTRNLAAYDAVLRAAHANNGKDMASWRRAVEYYERAVALDSTFALAWAGLSLNRSLMYFHGVPTPELAAAARAAGERAVRLAPNDPQGYIALQMHYRVLGDGAGVAMAYQALRRIDPNGIPALEAGFNDALERGRFEEAIDFAERAAALDPRTPAYVLAQVEPLLWLRRYPEALEASERASRIAPMTLEHLQNKTMIYLAQGDLEGARAVVREAPDDIEETALIAYFGAYYNLTWALEEAQQRKVVKLSPEDFDGNRNHWGLALAQAHALQGDRRAARAYADSARIAIQEQLEESPDNDQLYAALGLAYAYLGRRDDAITAGRRATELRPVGEYPYTGPPNHLQLAQAHVLLGEPEEALDQLELLLKRPFFVSPGWLRIDPTLGALRGHPRFERLVTGREE